MRRKVVAVWVSLLIMVSSIVILVEIAERVEAPTTLYVGGGGGGNYSKIQWAIDNASDGDTVFVYSGTYNEHVIVNKTINLTGENRDTTIIDGGRVGDVVTISVDWVNVTGFTFMKSWWFSGKAGLRLDNVKNCKVHNNVFSNNSYGLCLNYSNENNITGNIVIDNDSGISLIYSNLNSIVGNNATYNGGGIFLLNSIQNIISGNDALYNNQGFYISNSDSNNITGNVALNNSIGIDLYQADLNNITGNFISSNYDYGVNLYSTYNNTMINNQMIGNGIYISGGLGQWISHNIDTTNTVNGKQVYYWKNRTGGKVPLGAGQVILANCTNIDVENQNVSYGSVGILLGFSNSSFITNNTASLNTKYGIELIRSNRNELINNTVCLNNDFGFNIIASDNNTITNNNASSNGINGIALQISDNNNITHNTASSNNHTGISIQRSIDNKIINNTASYNKKDGISLYSADYNTITNNSAYFNTINGIETFKSDRITLTNNTALNNSFGIYITDSIENTIINNNVSYNNNGFYIYSSGNTIVKNTAISNNGVGIILVNSVRNTLVNNMMVDNSILITGSQLQLWNTHIIDTNNMVNGKPVYYWKNQTGGYIPQDAGQVILANSSGVTIENQNVSDGTVGILFGFSSYNIIDNITASSNNYYGIHLQNSNDNTVANSTVLLNSKHGIYLRYSERNTLSNNIASSNFEKGIYLRNSAYNIVLNNNASKNDFGVTLSFASDNTIINNTVSSNTDHGIHLSSSNSNKIYHNNFINNTNQAYDASLGTTRWDNGYPSGGNYWSDYNGSDDFKGVNQDIIGNDGLGDVPYTNFGGAIGNQDNYPLKTPYKPLENFTILKQGWNFISLPLIQGEQNLTRVLGSIDGWYDAVQWYDPADSIDPWTDTKIGKPFGNELNEINESMGFWVHITNPGDTIFIYNGTEPPSNQTIQLHPGWNMIGYPSLTNHNRTVGLNNLTFDTHVDAIQWYDAALKTWHFMDQDDSFVPGRGYWVHSKVDAEWEVPI